MKYLSPSRSYILFVLLSRGRDQDPLRRRISAASGAYEASSADKPRNVGVFNVGPRPDRAREPAYGHCRRDESGIAAQLLGAGPTTTGVRRLAGSTPAEVEQPCLRRRRAVEFAALALPEHLALREPFGGRLELCPERMDKVDVQVFVEADGPGEIP